jgi:hypothetical protein
MGDEGVQRKSNSAGSLAKITAERDICVLHMPVVETMFWNF